MNGINEINVRKTVLRDLNGIIKIAEKCQLSHWKKDEYAAEIDRQESLFLAAEVDRQVIGFALTRFNLLTVGATEQDGCATADILNIGVLEEYRKRGIGKLLLENIIAQARLLETNEIWLEVRESNFSARRFYCRNGFTETQKRRNYYSHPVEAAVLMKRAVKEEFIAKNLSY